MTRRPDPPLAESDFRRRVYAVVARVPRGRVITYGQLAALAGRPRAARMVGWIAHTGLPRLPWQRVVNRFGGLARGYTGGRYGHRRDLEREGVVVRDDNTVDLARYQWQPIPRPPRRRPAGRVRPAERSAGSPGRRPRS